MAGRRSQAEIAPRALFAWLVLAAIMFWVFINWPREPQKPVPVTAETTGTSESATGTPAAAEERVEVITESLNFRSEPVAQDKNIIKTLARGTMMKIKKKQEGWLMVELDSGETGYVFDRPGYVREAQ